MAPRHRATPWVAHGLLALILAGSLAGCIRPAPRADVVILNGAEPESLDPAILTGQPDMRVVRALFEGLVRAHPHTGEPAPALAERWDVSPDGKVYTFYLRPQARWSTGQPITSQDVAYSWLRTLNPATASDYAAQLFLLENGEAFHRGRIQSPGQVGLQTPDAQTVKAILHSPAPYFAGLCALPALMVVPKNAIEAGQDRWLLARPLPCSGPYTLDYWRIHDRIRVRKNPAYWNAASVRNQAVDFLPIESPSTALNLYTSKAADIIWDKGLIPGELMDALRGRPDCHTFDYLGTFFYRYNTTKPPFNDARVRRALLLAVDRDRIVTKITKGGERPAAHFTPPGIAHYEPPEGLRFDPDQARRLLAEAGYPQGQRFPVFEYLFKTGKTDEQIGIELQAMWKEVLGIRMELRQTEWKVFLAAQNALQFDLSRSSWVGDYLDPSTFLDLFASTSGNNRTGWSHPRYDRLLLEANGQTDPARRAALLKEAETILVREEVPIGPVYFYAGVNFYDPARIGGVFDNPLDIHPIESIYRIP